jgi:dCMP deaminase
MKMDYNLYFGILELYQQKSKCSKIKVAALAVKEDNPFCVGINGTLPGVENCQDYFKETYQSLYDLETLYKQEHFYESFEDYLKSDEFLEDHHSWSQVNEIHAEQNLIRKSQEYNISLKGTTIFLTHFCCPSCAKLLAICGIKELCYLEDYDRQSKDSRNVLTSAGISLKRFVRNNKGIFVEKD